MIEYRFKASTFDKLDELNKLMPNGKSFKVDKYTGEAWIKVTNSEHTTELVNTVKHFCLFSSIGKQLEINDCSSMNNTPQFEDTRDSLFE